MTYRDWLADDVRRLWSEKCLGTSHSGAVLGCGNAGRVFSWMGTEKNESEKGSRLERENGEEM